MRRNMRTSLARRRPLVVLAVPLSLSLVLSACGGASKSKEAANTSGAAGSTTSGAAAPASTTLHLSFLQDPGQPPDPDIYYAGQGLLLTQNLYEGLLSYKLGSAKAELAPGLATTWKASADFKTFTFTLRTGVTFHDGTPFDSSAVKASFDRRLAVNQGPAYMVSDVASVTATSKTEVVIKLKDANTAFLDYLACPYSPKMMSPTALAANKGSDNDQKYLLTHDIGTGPYTLTQANVGQNYQMKAYAGWWGPKVFFQTVEIPVV